MYWFPKPNPLREWCEKYILWVQFAVSALVAGAAYVVIQVAHLAGPVGASLDGSRTVLYAAASAGCAALLGCVFTAITLMVAVVQNPFFDQLRMSEPYQQALGIYFNTIKLLAGATFGFLIMLFLDTDKHPLVPVECLALGLTVLVALQLWNCLDVLETLVRASAKSTA